MSKNKDQVHDPVFAALNAFADAICRLREIILRDKYDLEAYYEEDDIWYLLEEGSQKKAFLEKWEIAKKEVQEAVPELGGDASDIGSISFDADIVHNTLFGLAYHIWTERLPNDQVAETAQHYATQLHELVSEFGKWHARRWLACIPLERLFSGFPEFVDFGRFQILNPVAETVQELAPTEALCHLLAKHLGVTFIHSDEIENSYRSKSNEILANSNGYIPGRPQLVLRLFQENAEARQINPIVPEHAIIRLRNEVAVLRPLLRLCQVACEEFHEEYDGDPLFGPTPAIDYWKAGEWSTLPDGTAMQHRYVEMPDQVMLIDKGTGSTPDSLFSLQYEFNFDGVYLGPPLDRPEYALAPGFETNYGLGYSAEDFMHFWDRIAVPVITLRANCWSTQHGKPPKELIKFLDAVDNAVLMAASCLHRVGGNFAAQCIMAAESILNPYKDGEGLAHKFALFSACLRSASMDKRKKLFREAKQLYVLRSVWAHGSGTQTTTNKPRQVLEPNALRLFLECLQPIVQWANAQLAAGRIVDRKSFQEMLEAKLFPVAKGSDLDGGN